MFILLENLSLKNKQIVDAVLQLPDVKIVPPISKRYGIFIIKNYSNSPKLKLPESDMHELRSSIEANTEKTSLITSHKPILQTCKLCRLKANGQDPQENFSFHS